MSKFINKFIGIVASTAFILTFSLQSAADINFTGVTQTDLENISNEFSGNFMHHSVMGASSMGTIFGVELGLIAGMQKTPEIDKIVKRSNPGSGSETLPHAGILAAVGVPFGLSGELVMIPKITGGGGEYQSTSMALKWTMNENLLVLPFNLAFRGIYSTSKFSFKQTIAAGLEGTVENSNTVSGLQVLISPSLPIFEPYAGIGMLSGSNTLAMTGAPGSIYDPSFTTSQSADASVKTTQYLIGANVRLLLLVFGLEVSNAFGTTSTTGKFSLAF